MNQLDATSMETVAAPDIGELIPGGVVVRAIASGDWLPGNLETTIIQTDPKTTCCLFPST
jgi:hypothetical protein